MSSWRLKRVFTGQAALVPPSTKRLVLANGSYDLSGQVLLMRRSRRLISSFGTYSIAGTAATLAKNGRGIVGNPGAYSLTGSVSILRKSRRLISSSGTYALTGTAATLWIGIPTPTYSWMTASSDTTPGFRVLFSGPQSGDIIEIEWSTSNTFSDVTIFTDDVNALTSTDTEVDFSLNTVSAGTYYTRVRINRGGLYGSYSSVLTVTIT